MPRDSENIPSATNLPKEDSKYASRSCILGIPKHKEESASTELCIYPLSTREKQTLDMFEKKHASQCIEFDSESLMITLKNIFRKSNFESNDLHKSGVNVAENTVPPQNIRDIISQIRFDCDPEGELRRTSFQILDVVMEYSWEAKMVLIMAALVTSYADFCVYMIRQTAINPSAKQNRPFQPTRESVTSNLSRLSNLVKNCLEVGSAMLQFKTERDQKDMADIEPKFTKVFQSVIYQIIKVGVACSLHIELVHEDIRNISLDTTEAEQQEKLLQELVDNQKNLTDFLSAIDREAAENFTPIEYLDIRIFFTKLFTEEKALTGEMVIPIVLDSLKGYTTGLLISDVHARIENFSCLIQTYNKIPKERKFRIVWIPVATMEWTDEEERSFCKMASSMPWCSCHPLMVTKAFSTHIAKNWQYKKMPSLVVLNEQAEVITYNALSVVEMWGYKAYPFSSDMEVTISKCWTIKSMIEDWEIDGLDLENDIVCVYGGDNLEMIRSFTKVVESIKHKSSSFQIKAIYAGSNGRKENLENIVSSLEKEDVKCLSRPLMSTFWNRLSIVLKTRWEDHDTLDEDVVTEQLTTLLAYNKIELWTTMMYKGSTELIKATGAPLLQYFEVLNGSKKEFKKTNELWDCLVHNTKPEGPSTLAINASAYERVQNLFGSEHQDVTEVLAKVFLEQTGIFDGQTGLEHFKGKSVGFLVTDAKFEEFTSVIEKYKQIHQGPDLKIIWIPIVDNDAEEKSFREKALDMRWYYGQLSMLTKDFSTYITQVCYSQTRSTLMVLNKHGKLVSTLQWEASTFPWEYQVEKEPRSNWFQYKSAKELDIRSGEIDVHLKFSTVYEYDGVRDVAVEVLEIFAPFKWLVGRGYNVKLAPNTLYEIIFLVMLTEEAQGWESPLCYSYRIPNDNNGYFRSGSELIDKKPSGVWFEVKLAEFSLLPGKTDGPLGFFLFGNEYKQKGLMIKGAGIREKKRYITKSSVKGTTQEPRSNWFQYKSAKELDIRRGQIDVQLKITTVYENDGTHDVPVEVLEIFAPVNWQVGKGYNVTLTPNTLYEIIFLVMLTEEAQGWDSPLCYSYRIPNDNNGYFRTGYELIDNKPSRVWFEVKLAEFSLQPGKTDGPLGFFLLTNECKQKGIMIKGAGIREKRK